MLVRCIPILLLVASVQAQDEPKFVLEAEVQRVVAASDQERSDAIAEVTGSFSKLLQIEAAPPMMRSRLLDQWRTRRTDVQTGSSGGSAGSTSTVLDPLLPATFSFALENGSIVRTVDGTTATVKINPAGLYCASGVNGMDSRAAALRDTGCLDVLRRTSVSFSFDTSRGEIEGVEGLVSLGDQFSEAAVRTELINRRTPNSRGFQRAMQRWRERARGLANVLVDLDDWLNRERPERNRQSWSQEIEQNIQTILTDATDRKEERIRGSLEQLARRMLQEMPERERDLLDSSIALWLGTLQVDNELYNRFAHGLVVTAEYAFQRPGVVTEAIDDIVPAGMRPPSLHTARLIVAKGLMRYNLDFALNISSSWFSETLMGVDGRWRDVQVGGEATFRLRDLPGFGAPAIKLAGLFVHLERRPLGFTIDTFNEQQINEPGNIGIFQAKLELPTANAAVRVPISFTYASRTELISESDVRGQIGISLNLDGLFPN